VRVMLLGEAPNCEVVARRPHLVLLPDDSGERHSANRLLEHTGYSREEYLRVFCDRRNLLRDLPPRAGRGRAFPRKLAEQAAYDLTVELSGRMSLGGNWPVVWPFYGPQPARLDLVVVLGSRVASAFKWHTGFLGKQVRKPQPLQSLYMGTDGTHWFSAALVPHPSGLCQWWNSADNRKMAKRFFEELKR